MIVATVKKGRVDAQLDGTPLELLADVKCLAESIIEECSMGVETVKKALAYGVAKTIMDKFEV